MKRTQALVERMKAGKRRVEKLQHWDDPAITFVFFVTCGWVLLGFGNSSGDQKHNGDTADALLRCFALAMMCVLAWRHP